MSITEVKDDKYWIKYLKKANKQDWIVKVQFFDREKGQWSEMLSPQVGFGETFRQDEETDEASINFKWRHTEKPNLKHMMWFRILHFKKGEEFKATYTDEGLPLNHNQYVLGDFQMAENKDKLSWIVKQSLLEPIERMKYVVGETLEFTNQTSKTVTDGSGNTVTYVKDPYNHLTALERFLKVTPANCDNYDEGYDPHKNKSWFNRVNILDKEFLKNIPFDSDSFTEPDFYTILFKYDKTTGRTPCMYFDIDPETDLPRNMERDEYLLKFLRQDGYDQPELKLSDLLDGAQNVVYKSSVANFATGVVSNVENLVTGSNTPYPFYKMYAFPEVNNNSRDLSNYNTIDSGWGITLPFPIKRVNKLIRRTALFQESLNSAGNGVTGRRIKINDIDLSNNCYEKQVYESLKDDEFSATELFYYEEGSNFIYIKNYYCPKTTNLDAALDCFLYYIEFEPLINAKISIGSQENLTIYNQVDSQVDFYKFNKHLQKYIKSMGKSDLTFSKKHYHYEEIYSVGSKVIDEKENKTYLITAVAYQNINLELTAVYQLNENHFRRSNSVRASKAIRANSSISYANIKERKINISEEFFVNEYDSVEDSRFSFIFNPFLEEKVNIPQCVLLKTISNLKKETGEIIEYSKYFALPIVCVPFDNQIIFVFNFKDNALIGKDKIIDSHKYTLPGNMQYNNSMTRISKQVDVLYTDPFGCVDNLEVQLCSNPQDMIDLEIGEDEIITRTVYYKYLSNYKRLAKVSLDDTSVNEMLENSIIKFNLNLYKDSLEKPTILFALKNTNKDIIFTASYIKAVLEGKTIAEPGDGLWFDFYSQTINEDSDTIGMTALSCCYGGILLSNRKEVHFVCSLIDKNMADKVKSIVIRKNYNEDALIIINNPIKDMFVNDFYILRINTQ